jgi:hypothetical protein
MEGSSKASLPQDDSGSVPLTGRNRFLTNHCLPIFPPHSERHNLCKRSRISLSHVKQQFVVIHTIRQNEIPALRDSWVTNTSSVEILYPQKNSFYLYFRMNITCLSVGLLRTCQVFSVPCRICVPVGYDKLLFHVRNACSVANQPRRNLITLTVQSEAYESFASS